MTMKHTDTTTETKYWFTSSSGRIEFQLTREQVERGQRQHHTHCDWWKNADSVSSRRFGPNGRRLEALANDPTIAEQFSRVSTDIMALELREYGAWSEEELQDRGANIRRLIWLACGDIQYNQF